MSTSTALATADPHHARRWIILAVLALCQLVAILDATVVNTALPTAQHELAFSDDDRQWIVTGYTLFGRKYALIIGLAGFAAASFLGGAAVNFGMLVTARILQGAFSALLSHPFIESSDMDAEVLRDLRDRRFRITILRHADDVVAELLGERVRH